jgi:hypothetical protein
MPFESFHKAVRTVKRRPGGRGSLEQYITYVVREPKGGRRAEIVIGEMLMDEVNFKPGDVVDVLFDSSDGLARLVRKANDEEGFKIGKRGKDTHGHISFKWAKNLPYANAVIRMAAEVGANELVFEFPVFSCKHIGQNDGT